ncbi:MAG: polysaccharide biosynthesis protein [Clostridia bacterium]|nr:polysaccharide biosynthesis protein [Clostridia bacterium]
MEDNTYYKKKILVVGGTGTIGKRLVNELLKHEPEVIRVFSRDEFKQFEMENELGHKDNIRYLIGDVRDYERIERASKGINVIFHLAAMKHVPACEYNPFEAVKTNVIGTQNLIISAIKNNVGRVIFTSSDKAISPTNAMGATKLLAEKLISSADYNKGEAKTIFSAVRFGNVMGSRGSVIPLFKKQILESKEITVTNPEMSRFMMSIGQAVSLTMKAALVSTGGEVFVLKMPVVRIKDLCEVVIEEMCKKYGMNKESIRTKVVGLRPGEKMYEELMTKEESFSTYDLGEMFAITTGLHEKDYESTYKNYRKVNEMSYSSEEQEPISKDQIRDIILSESLL